MFFTEFAKDKDAILGFEKNKKSMINYGDTATVYEVTENVVAKVYATNFEKIETEFKILVALSKLKEVVKPYALDLENNIIYMEYAKGKTLLDYLGSESQKLDIDSIFNGMKNILNLGFSPTDLHAENLIINNKGEAIFIDVENYIRSNEVFKPTFIDEFCIYEEIYGMHFN